MNNQSLLEVPVSFYQNCQTEDGAQTLTLLEILMPLKYQSQVEELRKITDDEERKKQKKKLPAFTPSGVFNLRQDSGLAQHSGLLALDIDAKDNLHLGNYSDLKHQLSKIKEIAYCGLSVSGAGFWCLIPIAYPEKHRQHFTAIQKLLNEKGLIIDPSCINVSRLRFISHDPEPYFNHHAMVFTEFDKPKPKLKVIRGSKIPATTDASRVEAMIQLIEQNRIDITDGYRLWFELGCAFANEFGETGRDYFHRISMHNAKYKPQDTDDEYDKYMKSDGRYSYTIGTFFYFCKLAGMHN